MKQIQEPKRPQLEMVYKGLFNSKIDKIISWVIPLLFGIISFIILFNLAH